MRRLRVLVYHRKLGRPGQEREEFEGAQAYVDGGWAEWFNPVEEAAETDPPETAAARVSPRRGPGRPRKERS